MEIENYEKPMVTIGRELRDWTDANIVAILTMIKNSKNHLKVRMGNLTFAQDVYVKLKKASEKKTGMKFYILFYSQTSISFDD
jgi:hypothetical protein